MAMFRFDYRMNAQIAAVMLYATCYTIPDWYTCTIEMLNANRNGAAAVCANKLNFMFVEQPFSRLFSFSAAEQNAGRPPKIIAI